MKIGLVDVDNYEKLNDCFPNIPLMKISAWHKKQGDSVEWHDPLFGGHYDKVYMSKVFSFTEDYPYCIDSDEIIKGGSGYCISLVDGKEVFDKTKNNELPYEIEHIMPDYSLYGITDTAYGFMSRGCPLGNVHDYCIVGKKEGLCSIKVADLSEFWCGQKNIQLCDPNTLACSDWKDILQQLIDSKAYVDFNQGVDIRLMTEEKAEMLSKVKIKQIHFAFDRYQEWNLITKNLKRYAEKVGYKFCRSKVQVYVLCNFDTTIEQNLERIYYIRSLGMSPYVMLYDKEHIPKGHELRKLQRWVNNRIIFWTCERFEDYMKKGNA